jgi:hypothetical protein
MTVYLKTQGQIFNLSICPSIKQEGKSVKIGDADIWCRYEDVAYQLVEDILLSLKALKKNVFFLPVDTFIEPFTGEDKYSQQIKSIEDAFKEEERQAQLRRVLDVVEKGATRCFVVKADVDYDSHFAPNPFVLNECIYANNEKTVEVWLRQTVCKKKPEYGNILREGSLEIKPAPNSDIFHCYAYLNDWYNQNPIHFIYKDYDRYLDYRDYEEKEAPHD